MGFASVHGETNPMVAVRSAGLAFDSVIGYQDDSGSNIAFVDEDYLQMMVGLANERSQLNSNRIQRFRDSLLGKANHATTGGTITSQHTTEEFEDPEIRRQRKRQEGLLRQQDLHDVKSAQSVHEPDVDLGGMFD
jgi:tRNA wybutosine-synthesizing protein 3